VLGNSMAFEQEQRHPPRAILLQCGRSDAEVRAAEEEEKRPPVVQEMGGGRVLFCGDVFEDFND